MEVRHRAVEEVAVTSNATVYWKLRRQIVLSCSYCRPNGVDNGGRSQRRFNDRYKDRRKGGCARRRNQE
jgi:hypothetical protein